MKFLCHYLAQHREFDKAVILFGLTNDYGELSSVLDTCSFTDACLVLEDELSQQEDLESVLIAKGVSLPIIAKKSFLENISAYKDHALVVLGFGNKTDLYALSSASFEAVIGMMPLGYDTFGLWETFRESAKTIVLARYVNPYRNEVLEWDKDQYEKELSIVFPVYNVASYLAQCVETVTAWDAPYVEFLFVSDGSPDNSVELLREFSRKDPRIKVFEKENGGCASARQYGLERAKGRYIGFVDPDDFVDKTMFRKLFSRAMSGSYEIAYSGYNEYYEDTGESQPIEDTIGFPYDLGTTDVDLIDELIAFRRIAIWRGIYASSLLQDHKIGFHTEIKRFDDLPFKVETLAVAKSVVSVPEYLYYYRLGRKGQDVAADDERLYVHFDIFAILDAFFAGTRSSRQADLYRIVKAQTHAWALSRIKYWLREEYRQRAAEDIGIENTPSAWKKMIRSYGGRKAVEEYALTYLPPEPAKKSLSIIIPFYNRIGTIGKVASTLRRSKGLNYEIIVVDDGSDAPALKNLDSLLCEDEHCKILTFPHHGVSNARNAGLRKAKGDYVWFVDSDDEVLLSALGTIPESFEGEECDVIAFDAKTKKEGKVSTLSSSKYGQENPLEVYLSEAADNPFLWNKLYRRGFLLENGIFFEEGICLGEDALFNFRCFQKAKKTKTVHRPLYTYVIEGGGSVTSSYLADPSKTLGEHIKVASRILEDIKGETLSEEAKRSLGKYLECLLARDADDVEILGARDKLNQQIHLVVGGKNDGNA